MMKTTERKYVIIVNPIAGGKNPIHIVKSLKKRLDSSPKSIYKILYSKNNDEVKSFAKTSLKLDYNVFVVIGGDGTVNEVASILNGSDKALGIIPTGSGNGFYNSLYGKIKMSQAIDRILNFSNTNEIDTGTFGGHFFSNVSGVGFDGHITKLFSNSKKRGLATYLRLISYNYFSFSPIFFSINTNKKTIKGRYFSVCIANGKEVGNQFQLNPEGKMNDGIMELCLLKKPKIYDLPIILLKLLFGKYDFTNFFTFIPTKAFIINIKENVPFHVDGNFISEKEKKISFSINKDRLRIISD